MAVAAWLVVLIGLCLPAAAQRPDDLMLTTAPEFGPAYPPQRWVPVRLEMQNRTDQLVEGSVLLPVNDPAGGIVLRMHVNVPPHSRFRTTSYAYFPEPAAGAAAGMEGRHEPITIPQWRRADGGLIARTEMLAVPLRSAAGAGEVSADAAGRYVLTVSGAARADDREAFDLHDFAQLLEPLADRPLGAPLQVSQWLPRRAVAYDGCLAVVLDEVHPDDLDPAQRAALLEYVTGGGVLIVPVPRGEGWSDSWLSPYLPVQLVGDRHMDQIVPAGAFAEQGPLRLRELLPAAEAIVAGGTVLLRDEHYVHAAYSPAGLGRVVFVSFPVNGLDPEDPRWRQLWRELLAIDRVETDLRETRLFEQRDRVLQTMIGMPAARWSVAAAIVLGYLGLILVIQFAVGGPRRPAAFALSVIAAVIGAVVLVAAAQLQRQDYVLAGGRLAVIDLGTDGGGTQQEIFAYAGDDVRDFRLTAAPSASLRPVAAAIAPTVETERFHVAGAAVHPARIDHVWQAKKAMPTAVRVTPVLRFGPRGPAIEFDNQLGQAVTAPLLLWNRHAIPLDDVEQGTSAQAVTRPVNPPGDFTNVAVFSPEVAKVRSDIIEAALLPPADRVLFQPPRLPPLLAGWLAEQTPRLAETSVDPQPPLRTQALLRVPVRIEPTEVGSSVRIPGPFNEMVPGELRGLPYDPMLNEWHAISPGGAWLVGFQPPREIGPLRVTRATVEMDISAAQHTVTLRRGQVRQGQPVINPQGTVIAQWRNPIAGQSPISFEVGPEDVDAEGRAWLYLEIEAPPLGTTLWQVRSFSVSLEGEVTEP